MHRWIKLPMVCFQAGLIFVMNGNWLMMVVFLHVPQARRWIFVEKLMMIHLLLVEITLAPRIPMPMWRRLLIYFFFFTHILFLSLFLLLFLLVLHQKVQTSKFLWLCRWVVIHARVYERFVYTVFALIAAQKHHRCCHRLLFLETDPETAHFATQSVTVFLETCSCLTLLEIAWIFSFMQIRVFVIINTICIVEVIIDRSCHWLQFSKTSKSLFRAQIGMGLLFSSHENHRLGSEHVGGFKSLLPFFEIELLRFKLVKLWSPVQIILIHGRRWIWASKWNLWRFIRLQLLEIRLKVWRGCF